MAEIVHPTIQGMTCIYTSFYPSILAPPFGPFWPQRLAMRAIFDALILELYFQMSLTRCLRWMVQGDLKHVAW